jgi:hypothetical protein
MVFMTSLPEHVAQSAASLTANRKVWGSIRARDKALLVRLFSLSILSDKTVLVVQSCGVPTLPFPGMVIPVCRISESPMMGADVK